MVITEFGDGVDKRGHRLDSVFPVGESRTVAQSLAEIRDSRTAFAFVEWFAREWLTPIRDDDGCSAEEVAATEERLGLRLPASLVAFYRLLGRRRDLTSNQDRLIAMNSLTVDDGVLIYRIEAQACASWGARVSDLGLADPPVVCCEGYRDGSPWLPFLGSFSLAAVEMVLFEAIFADAAGRHDNRGLDDADIARLEEDSRTWLWALTRSAASLASVRDALPGEWLMTSV